MNIDEKENYGQVEKYFQNHRRQYEDPDIDSPPLDHSITENAEPDYSSDLVLNEERSDDENQEDDNDLDDDDDDIEEESDTYDKE